MPPDAALTLNLLLRGATVGALLLVAAALWRDRREAVAIRLGAGFAIGVAASTLGAMPGFSASHDGWHATVGALSAGSMFVFWLFTRALFDDDFRLRAWQLVVWLALATIGALGCLLAAPQFPAAAPVLGALLGTLPVVWATLAIVQTIATWREDLVEGRRRLRTVIVAATAIYTVGQLLAALVSGLALKAVVESAANAAGTAVLTLFVAWQLMRARTGELFAPAPAGEAATPPAEPAAIAPDARQLATLDRLMATERIYREPSLTIAALALRMGLPEHRVRKLINQGLGHRNFNAFLNAHRVEDAKRALADPTLAEVPVLTIAMDAGFQSIGPFNRAFKAATGRTPSEYRRGPVQTPPTVEVAETETA